MCFHFSKHVFFTTLYLPIGKIMSGKKLKSNFDFDKTNGVVCEPALLSDETAATIPTGIQGSFSFTYNYAEPESPFSNGTKASFTITAGQELIVELDGEDCYTLKNPALRFNGAAGNYFFKDDCVHNICFNVSENQDGTLNEINVQPVSGVGWYGQFVLN
jgi:hypothetical protein